MTTSRGYGFDGDGAKWWRRHLHGGAAEKGHLGGNFPITAMRSPDIQLSWDRVFLHGAATNRARSSHGIPLPAAKTQGP
jgi:hypothetical protein